MRRILFVCHGNICRSPAAEFIMKDRLAKAGRSDEAEVDSFATSFEEIGNDVYPPMRKALAEAGIAVGHHAAKRISQRDYDEADEVYYMDEHNLSYLRRSLVDRKGIIRPVTCFAPELSEIEDPWYTGRYSLVVRQISRCVDAIIAHLRTEP